MKHNYSIDIDLRQVPDHLRPYLIDLANEHGKERIHAREYMEKLGPPVLPYLEMLLQSENRVLRWEASKIMQLIGDISSLTVFLDLLEDEDHDIRWIASEGLVQIGEVSLKPLLKRMIDQGSSSYLNAGAVHLISSLFHGAERKPFHHFLRILKKRHQSGEVIASEALRLLRELG